MSAPVTVLVTARDEEDQLPQALAAVAGFADEIVAVIDPRTRDRTRDAAVAAGARVLEHPFVSSAAQCNWGLDQCGNDWVLVLDADERVSPRLGDGIAAALVAPPVAAFKVRRINFAFGRPLRFGDWGADAPTRLLDRREARFVERAVHGVVRARSVGRLSGELEHHTLRSMDQYLPKLHDYAHRGAAELVAAGRRSSTFTALAHAEWRFLRSYVLRLGFLDGNAGFVVAVLAAYGSFLKWTTAWETMTFGRSGS